MAGKKVLFFTPFGHYLVHNQVDAILASALRVRGAETAIIGCDGLYNKCDILVRAGQNSHEQCQRCFFTGRDFFARFQLPVIQLRQHLNENDYNVAQNWANSFPPENFPQAVLHGFPIGHFVKSSVHSYFRITDNELLRPDVIALYRQYLVNGALTLFAVWKILDQEKPSNMVVFNARFAPYRIAFEIARSRGIDVIMHERGFADDTFTFWSNAKCTEIKPLNDCAENWGNISLINSELERVQEFIENREKGKDLNVPGFYDFTNEASSVRHSLRIPADARIMGIFTSTESEIASAEEFSGVSSQLETIVNTIEIFKKRPKDYLVIRHHPNLGGAGDTDPEHAFLSKSLAHLKNLPENVRIIMPKEKLSTYALLWNIDSCFALFSTVGLEAPSRGVATAGLHGSPFALAHPLKMMSSDNQTIEELVDKLFERSANFGAEDLRMGYRFITTLISRISAKLKACGMKDHFDLDIRIAHTGELAPGNDPALDRICDFVMKGTTIYPQPSQADINRSTSEEDLFFQTKISQIKDKRTKILAESKLNAGKSILPAVAVVSTSAPEWIGVSRHKKINFYKISEVYSIQNLHELVAGLSEEFVLITNSEISYDTSFISSSVDFLLEDTISNCGGVLNGAWLLDKEGNVKSEALTKRKMPGSYPELLSRNQCFSHPAFILGLCLFRRDWLKALLNECTHLKDNAEIALFIYSQLPTLKMYASQVPNALIYKA